MKTEYTFKINGKISSCFSCPFHFSDGDIHCVLKKNIICLTYEKPSKCPLKELPQHGDLIDRSELPTTSITDYAFEGHTVVEYEDIKNAPTILEASEE